MGVDFYQWCIIVLLFLSLWHTKYRVRKTEARLNLLSLCTQKGIKLYVWMPEENRYEHLAEYLKKELIKK